MTTNDKALAVRWPMANAPEFASIHVANSTRTTADPGIIWDWLTRPEQWHRFYANAKRFFALPDVVEKREPALIS